MPRQRDKHRNIEITIGEDGVEEALAMWVTKYHGIDVDRKQIAVEKGQDGKLIAKITKKPERDEPESDTLAPAETTGQSGQTDST
jgi:hypothetical protein